MEMVGGEIENLSKSYYLSMFKDFVPMCIFYEADQGKGLDSFPKRIRFLRLHLIRTLAWLLPI